MSLQKYTKSDSANGTGYGFVLIKPDDYTPTKKYPILCFLHGTGGRGDGEGGLNVLVNGELPKQIQAEAPLAGIIVIAPQVANNYSGNEPDAMFDWAERNLSVDPLQEHQTGLSLGAGASLFYAISSSARAKRLATLSFVATTNVTGNYKNIADANLAVWGFHNIGDDNNGTPVAATDYAITAINSYGGFTAVKTEFNANGHGGWDIAYGKEPPVAANGKGLIYPTVNIYEWMKLNRRGAPVAVPGSSNTGNLIANAGGDYTTNASPGVLDGSKSQNYTSASWSIVSAPSGINPWDSAKLFPDGSGWFKIKVVFPKTGTYTFRLAVKDGKGAVATDDITITYTGTQSSSSTTTTTTVITKVELSRTWIAKIGKFVYVYDDGTTETK